jgi:prepilin-type N-terminal cleavage/methylation domain-containing protein
MTIRKQRALDAGVTLLELLVVLIIVGLLAAVSVPSFVNARQKNADKSIEADMKAVANQVETWLTDNPSDLDGPAAWNAPLSNYTSTGAIRPYIELQPLKLETYKVPLDAGNFIKVYTNSQIPSYCVAGASKKTKRGWNESAVPTAANVIFYDPLEGKISTTPSAGCEYRTGNSLERPDTTPAPPVHVDPALPTGFKCTTFTQAAGATGFRNLSWGAVSGATSYRVNQYRNGVLDTTNAVTGTTATVKNTSPDTWQYTVEAEGAYFTGPCTPPTYVPPGYDCVTFSQAAGATGFRTLSWTAVPETINYRVREYKNGVLQSTRSVTTLTATVANTAPDTWQYTVDAYGPGFTGPCAAPVYTPPPSGYDCVTFTQAAGATGYRTLTWVAVSGATNYRVREYKNGVLQTTSTVYGTTDSVANTAPDTWQYTVDAYGPGFTGPCAAPTYTPPPPLPDGYDCITFTKTAGATTGQENLSWGAVANANGYRLKTYRNGALETTAIVTGTSIVVNDPAPDYWAWTVEARGPGFTNDLCPVPPMPKPSCATGMSFGGPAWQPTSVIWVNPANSTGTRIYMVMADGTTQLWTTSTGTTATLPTHVRNGTYQGVKIIPFNAAGEATGCTWLATTTYVVPCPSAYVSGTTLYWTPPSGARASNVYSRVYAGYMGSTSPGADALVTSNTMATTQAISTTKFEYKVTALPIAGYTAATACSYYRYYSGGTGGTRPPLEM